MDTDTLIKGIRLEKEISNLKGMLVFMEEGDIEVSFHCSKTDKRADLKCYKNPCKFDYKAHKHEPDDDFFFNALSHDILKSTIEKVKAQLKKKQDEFDAT